MSVVELKPGEVTQPETSFSHVKEGDTHFHGTGLRGFFEYRDLGIADATNGRVIAHLVRAKNPPKDGTGWHRHVADFQIVLMTKGWARFMYEDKETFVQAGDCVHQRPASCIICSIIRPTWNIWRSSARPISAPSTRPRRPA
jgi:hypothetical protein